MAVYTVFGSNLTLANAAVTLVFINPSSTAGIEIIRCWCVQRGTLTSQNLGIQLNTQVTAFPTLVSATPVNHYMGGAVSGIVGGTAGAAGTCGVNASAEGAGAKTIVIPDAFNNLNGYIWVPTDLEKLILIRGLASGFGLHLPAAPTVLTGWTFGVTYRELD